MPGTGRLCMIAFAALALAGCSGGGGDESGALGRSIAVATAPYVILDLSAKQLDGAPSIADLTTNLAYTSGKIVFRRVAGGSFTMGQTPGTLGAQADETPSAADIGTLYIAVFELTQAQWQGLAGSGDQPWTAVPSAVAGGVVSLSSGPAFNLAKADIDNVLAAYASGSGFSLRVPSAAEWEYACRAGASTIFAWGNGAAQADATPHAVLRETLGGVSGVRRVGQRQANAFGLYDMHGNVWEWVSNGQLRGGGWKHGLMDARCANGIAVPAAIAHPLAGVRLVLVL